MQAKAKCAIVLLLGCSRYHVRGAANHALSMQPGHSGGAEAEALSAHGFAVLSSAQAQCGLQVFEVQQAITRGMREAACLVQCNCNVYITLRGVLRCQVSPFLFLSFDGSEECFNSCLSVKICIKLWKPMVKISPFIFLSPLIQGR